MKFFIILLSLLFATSAEAYILPDYKMTEAGRQTPAEDVLAKLQAEADRLPIFSLEEARYNYKERRNLKERADYIKLSEAIAFWKYVTAFKSSLLSLKGANGRSAAEADSIAKTVIETIYSVSRGYGVSTINLFHNSLINLGLKEKGFCYHYVNDMLSALKGVDIEHFELRWGEAYAQKTRENNALVITARGRPFETGIAVDVWRRSGRPFWTPVRGDRYPWVENAEYTRR